ncbi:storkhead-box protein 1 isoform X1 [Myiozetetes cayanensis]|uniref:storkhead-box protein 1 isoform X1 n=1 Tax=Myiozetetes cayanensis TaxID=478635 RepID=UPI0021605C90|nr:storkhead-box protein 1 isoform X1 [Myiozetetes cayanensis]XP_050161422.1 storkhead-box protein 1 isoform X1 [Myiozetetes cayanensis]XP_050161423.1 storkhead-box protein 1 isoform X1 [Myiozetetes cayanensis]XP_050161424.1 storkhead-box protein 1 isoform X1 [Myiozetetes cayanensis]XP_050161425.1 storkhead-box protein 1 isoform X1 [Myiozetetes cayanensis]
MNPLLQSCSLSLAEGICCTISDMNADHVMVTQETLAQHLEKNYPGIAVPSHSTLYNILGTLIKERKIYHSGEGYFIVTPNTYLITNKATEENRRVLLEDSCCCSAPSITYLVNIKHCANLVKENVPTVSCYRSCHCFSVQNMLCEQRHWQLVNHEPKGKGKKDCRELKPSIETQGICTSAENHVWDTIKSLTSMKAKLKSKRFGLGLFWRSFSKKEKHKKEYSTFSAQFPPREWPVRDEDDLDNIPRDIEHEIIKRINPTLTVDNLIKHTILMQKLEEQKKFISKEKKYISNGTSAEVSAVRQNHLSKDCIQKARSKPAKRTRKTKSKKEKQIGRSSRKSPVQELTPQHVQVEESLSLSARNQEPPAVAVQSPVFYKKQITNPFQALPWRRSFYAQGYRGVINRHLKSQAREQGRASHRTQPSASWRPPGYKTQQLADRAKQNPPHAHRSCLQLQKDSLRENCSCLQGSNLQIDNKSKHFLESNISEENSYGRTLKRSPGDIKKSTCFYTEHSGVCKEDAKLSFCLKDEHCRGKADTVGELLDRTANEFQNVHLSNYTANVNLVRKNGVKCRQKTDKKSELIFNYDCASHHGPMELEREGFTDNCRLQNQKGHDGDTCNQLGDSSEGCEPCHPLPPGHAFSDTRDWNAAVSLKPCEVSNCPAQCNTTVTTCDSGEQGCKGSGSFAESTDGLKEHPKPDSAEESWLCSQVLPRGHREAEGMGLPVAGSHLAAQAHSDNDTGHNFPPEEVGGGGGGGKKELVFKNTCSVISGQKHSEGTESPSFLSGDSGIDSPGLTEKKMKVPDES